MRLLVEKIALSRNEDGRPKVEITYRFGPPEASLGRMARMVDLTV